MILAQEHEDLLNRFTLIPVNPSAPPSAPPSADYRLAMRFVEWLTSADGHVIGEFGVERYGEPLFFPDVHADAEA